MENIFASVTKISFTQIIHYNSILSLVEILYLEGHITLTTQHAQWIHFINIHSDIETYFTPLFFKSLLIIEGCNLEVYSEMQRFNV